jgi:hypothetical protein
MSAYSSLCPPDDCGPCGTLPPGFVRLRYFYGKRLGVVDFRDEQRYHAGKMRFHNRHLHGAGVLCGLGTSLFAVNETVVRVGKGAALDACGREIIVGYEQCIDVDAWYVRLRARELADDPAWTPPLDGDLLRLCVALRFRECPSGIEPAPRDPCACDASGSDYGRVREEFQLELVLHEAAHAHVPPPIAPPRPGLDVALARAIGGGDLTERVRALLHAGCAEVESDDWLVLACFGARLDPAREHVTEIVEIESVATMLYSSALIEELVVRDVGATLEAGALAAGAPEIDAFGFTLGDPSAGDPIDQLDRLELALTGPIVEATALGARYELRRLTTQWDPPASAPTIEYDAGGTAAPPTITVAPPAGFLVAGGNYRLAVIADVEEPIVDEQLRPLRPLRPSFHFRIIDDGGVLKLAPAPFAEAP